jgi:8-oxo-dGTP pyrophosphatase MutT (NUDIX family)
MGILSNAIGASEPQMTCTSKRLARTGVADIETEAGTAVGSPEVFTQVAALPILRSSSGALEVLLITTRDTGRWIIPKGWPMKGRKDHKAAAREAREEAGVVGRIRKRPLGRYLYGKCRRDRVDLCEVTVYPLLVERQRSQWLERGQRAFGWFSVEDAAARVQEPGLRRIIRELGTEWREASTDSMRGSRR